MWTVLVPVVLVIGALVYAGIFIYCTFRTKGGALDNDDDDEEDGNGDNDW